jgi:SEL1 protein
MHLLTLTVATKKDWTLTEWLSAFLEAELGDWADIEQDDYDDNHAAGDDYYDETEIDSDILESLVILALSGALAGLLYYRAQRQRRQEEERRRQEQQQQQINQGIPVAPQQPPPPQDRGLFPDPNEPDFMNWVAGGAGH